MAQEYIEIRGARENNLNNVSLRIPKRKITIFTGVSGSGKSSIVFDTVASEARRQLNETFSTFVRNFLPKYAQPDVDSIENLSMAIVVDQKHLGGGSHSTVGTITDIYSLLRLLYSRVGVPSVPNRNAFSFNDPQGMCPNCNGLGRKIDVDLDAFLDRGKSLNEGAILYSEYAVDGWAWAILPQSGLFDMDKKLSDYSAEELELLLHSEPRKVKTNFGGKVINITFEGIVDKFRRKYITGDVKSYSERTQKEVAPYMTYGPCTHCHGARLNAQALACRVDGRNIAEMAAMEVDELVEVVRKISNPVVAQIVDTVVLRLQNMIDIGLEYLSLDRETDSLSGGESQRIKMVKHLSSSLTDVLYIFDEPSIGLHPRDVHRLNELLQRLRDKGNTVIVVEHDPDVIKIADHVVDVGPHAGRHGGQIVFEGTYEELKKAHTLTARFLNSSTPIPNAFRSPQGTLKIVDANVHNLQNVSVDLPIGVLTVVTGVAGSGKSSLIHRSFLKQHPDAVVIDQSAVGTSSRSNPATYTGILDDVRKLFAATHKVNAALFSFNSKGACETCQGLGVVYTDVAFLDEVKTPCETCGGKRFKEEVLSYTIDGKSISDVLNFSVAQALEFFPAKEINRKLQALSDVGLDYLSLGQPLSTLSGGECQRIKLASELQKKGSVYVMDEPTTGLHMSDIDRFMKIVHRLVDAGNTVVVIEHNLEVIRNADWIVDMGPEGGNKGGKVVFEGTPAQLAKSSPSLTAKYLVS